MIEQIFRLSVYQLGKSSLVTDKNMSILNIFTEGVEWDFLYEIIGRSLIMFLLILLVLRISGKRGVRQLTLFEVAIVLGLGSAAGDPMFQEDIPILYAAIVLFTVILLYKLITWLASKSQFATELLEGKPMLVVKDGMFDTNQMNGMDFSKLEFFTELRNLSIEHLGQVRRALLETDGSMSVLYYSKEEIRFGLPLFPEHYQEINQTDLNIHYLACMHCGNVVGFTPIFQTCERCKKKKWTKAMNTKRL